MPAGGASDKDVKAAGIQPIAFDGEDIYFLLGQERYDKGWADSDKWASFGGRRETNETVLTAAVREGYEESMGILGDINCIRRQLRPNAKGYIGYVAEGAFRTYLYEIPYDRNLPKMFDNMLNYFKQCGDELSKCPHGLFEKSAIKWFDSKELARLAYVDFKSEGNKILRYHFAMAVGKMISAINKYKIPKSKTYTKRTAVKTKTKRTPSVKTKTKRIPAIKSKSYTKPSIKSKRKHKKSTYSRKARKSSYKKK